ncbi:MAG: SDR family oxidoreductase [Alphaproteobacteria bacterium]|nr:SDR family oxidoreductase [Alphaproteobacteria bacterium]
MDTQTHSEDRLDAVALITGAASGIGAALAQRLSPRATGGLILVDHNERGLARVADHLPEPPERVSTLAFDVTDPRRWAQAGDFIMDQYGRLDWAAANAGVAHASSIPDLSYEEWRRVMSVNLDGVFLTLKTVMPIMRLSAQGGAIVVTASAAGVKAEPNIAAYGASKAGVLQLMRVAAREGAPDGIRVNAVAPGGVETPMWREQPFFQDLLRETGSERAAFDRLAAGATPLGRYASADEVARLMEHLLCDSAPVTGATLVVDGGYTL